MTLFMDMWLGLKPPPPANMKIFQNWNSLLPFPVPVAEGYLDLLVVRVAVFESSISVETFSPPLGNSRVELLLL